MTSKADMQASEPQENELDVNAEAEETEETSVTTVDPLEQAEADLKAAKAEAAEWQDRFLRKAAEFENYKKRTDKEKIDSLVLAKSSVLMEFLPVADACERALDSMGQSKAVAGDLEQYHEGVELLYKQLLDTFGRVGVVP
ncbi:MAG: nucleotide exchange factor GrpE, partial [Acidobacteriota bacterium]